jgi:hypothetical protein
LVGQPFQADSQDSCGTEKIAARRVDQTIWKMSGWKA